MGGRFPKVPETNGPEIKYSNQKLKKKARIPANKLCHLGLLIDSFILLSTKVLKPLSRMYPIPRKCSLCSQGILNVHSNREKMLLDVKKKACFSSLTFSEFVQKECNHPYIVSFFYPMAAPSKIYFFII